MPVWREAGTSCRARRGPWPSTSWRAWRRRGIRGWPGCSRCWTSRRWQPDEQAELCNRYHFELFDALENDAPLGTRLAVVRRTNEVLQQLCRQDPGNAGWQRDLSVSHNKLGDVLSAQGDLTAALAAYRASLEISERLAAADPGNAGWQRDLSVSQDKLGDVLSAQGDLTARAGRLPGESGNQRSGWRRPTRATPAGNATCRSAMTNWATCSARRGT